MTNTGYALRSVAVAALAALSLLACTVRLDATPPLAPVAPGVAVSLDHEGEDVLGCLAELGYAPAPGADRLQVLAADLAWCAARV